MNAVLAAQHADESIVMEGMNRANSNGRAVDAYFSADVETDGPIPGPYSILSFGLVYAGVFDGSRFTQPENYAQTFYRELKPISEEFQSDALRVNGLDRNRLLKEGASPDRPWRRRVAGLKESLAAPNLCWWPTL